MRKKNQVSSETPPPASSNGWTEGGEQRSPTLVNQEEETHDEQASTDAEPAVQIARENTRRFKRYSRHWTAVDLNASSIGSNPPSSQPLEEVTDSPGSEPNEPSKALLNYFLRLAHSEDDVDFTYIESLLANEADINAVDESTGNTVMHEVAENWDTTVAEFLYERGIDIHAADKSGKTALHIAASTNHRDMVVWLITQGADIEAMTIVEKQTPVHYAARNDSVQALEALIHKGGEYECRDYKGRTPLHLAAELDRTIVAEFLVSLDTPAKCTVTDDAGSHVITSMIRTMPQVAVQSLNQLHKLVPADRKQFYMLSNLEHKQGDDHAEKGIKSPFEMAVEQGRYEILTHTVMEELIKQKWKKCVRWYYCLYLGLYVLFLISWSILFSYPSVQLKHIYVFPTDIWRIGLELIALGTYIHQIADEIIEIVGSNLNHKKYTAFRRRTLQDDLDNTDHSLPEERKYLISELESTKKSPPSYFKDPWNIIDITTYLALLLVIVLHVVDIAVHTTELAIWTARFSCVAVLLIWVRLLKLMRALKAFGPLVAIIGELIADILRYFVLYSVFFVPYMISVWVLFGGDQSVSVAGSEDLTVFYRVMVVMFRMSLIDSFPYETMRDIDELMTSILVITFLIITAVVGLNLFIALLSDTFQRVYDNAQANALLQQAKIILQLEDKVSSCTYQRYLIHIHNNCNPYTCYYDDDDNSEDRPAPLQKITHQIHGIVTELQNERKEMGDHERATILSLKDQLNAQDSKLLLLTNQMEELRGILVSMIQPSVRAHPSLSAPNEMDYQTKHPHLASVQDPINTQHGGFTVRQVQPRLERKLTPIETYRNPALSRPHRKQQSIKSIRNLRSNPNMYSTDKGDIETEALRSSSAPWTDRVYSISESSLQFGSPNPTPTHRRIRNRI